MKKEKQMSDNDSHYQDTIAHPILHRWGLRCILRPVDEWYDAFEVSYRDQHLLITVCFDYHDNPYWLFESPNLTVTERIASLRGSGVFPFWFLEWNGLDQVVSNTNGRTYIYCLNFSTLTYLIAYLFGVNRLWICPRAPFSYLIEKTKALLEGRALQRTPFESDQRLISPWYSRVADVFILWRENI